MKSIYLIPLLCIIQFLLFPLCSWGQYQHLKQATALDPNSIQKTTQPIHYKKPLQINPTVSSLLEKNTDSQSEQMTEKLIINEQQVDLSSVIATRTTHQLQGNPDIEIVWDKKNVPIFMKGKGEKRLYPITTTSRSKAAAEKIVYDFLDRYKSPLQITTPKDEFRVKETITDVKGNQHIRMQQVYQGIPVLDKQLIVHVAKDGIYALNGRYEATPTRVVAEQQITAERALQIIEADLGQQALQLPAQLQALLGEGKKPELVFFLDDTEQIFRLAWHIEFHTQRMEDWRFIIDAGDGRILKKTSTICNLTGPTTAVARDLYNQNQVINTWEFEDGSGFYMMDASRPMFDPTSTYQNEKGAIVTLDAEFATEDVSLFYLISDDNTWTDPAAVTAHHHAGICYEYFRQTFNRNSIDGQGGNIISVVNFVGEPDPVYGSPGLDNAGYSSTGLMLYGVGDVRLKEGSVAKALDIAAHEMSHGVVRNSAGLIYEFQSGALNESFADIFGTMVDRDDWQLAEDIVNPFVYRSGAMRDLSNPNNGGSSRFDQGWQPANMGQYLSLEEDDDKGGVHINSGIPNHAFYLFAEAVGKDKAEQVYYKALTEYLTPTSQFIDCRLAVIAAAEDLYSTAEVAAATAAFDAVGIFGDQGTTTQQDLPAVTGPQFLLTQGFLDGNMVIGEGDFSTGDYYLKSNIGFNPRLSVLDNGNFACFIGLDSIPYILDLNSTDVDKNYQPFFTNNGGFKFHKMALSRNGRLAAFLVYPLHPTILLFDSETQEVFEFPITNPNTGTGAASNPPDYLDVIRFDPTGQYLLYDAYNTTSQNNGFWDIGIIRVWNNSTNSLGDGTILKPFGTIPSGVSVGNPIFSNTSVNRIAYELFDFQNERMLVLALDFNQNEPVLIAENSFYPDFSLLGRPCYAPDDLSIAYVTDKEDTENYIIFQSLGTDKVSPIGLPTGKVYGEAPMWYAKGTRNFLPPTAAFQANITEGPATLTVNFRDESTNVPLTWNWTFEGGTPTTSTDPNPVVSYSTPGIYDVELQVSNDAGTDQRTRTAYIVVSANTTASLDISLEKGWNMISLNLMPSNNRVTDILSPIIDKVVVIKNSVGTNAIPGLNINNIGNWNPLEGYQIKMNDPATFILSGTPIDTQTAIPIKKGWQIIPYLGTTVSDPNAALSSIINDIVLVKDHAGNAFIPDLNINQIGNLQPAKGYWLKAKNDTTLRFPKNVSSP